MKRKSKLTTLIHFVHSKKFSLIWKTRFDSLKHLKQCLDGSAFIFPGIVINILRNTKHYSFYEFRTETFEIIDVSTTLVKAVG